MHREQEKHHKRQQTCHGSHSDTHDDGNNHQESNENGNSIPACLRQDLGPAGPWQGQTSYPHFKDFKF